MQCRYHTLLSLALVSLLPTTAVKANATDNAPGSKITIGGVVFTDLEDPVRSGVQGVTVTIEGDNGRFEATTGGIIGLWKVDVPQGTYTVTPKKKDYLIEHSTGVASDGKRSITIEVMPENMAANQSICFLAMVWPEEAEEQMQQEREKAKETSDTGRTGGGLRAGPRGLRAKQPILRRPTPPVSASYL